MKIMGDFNHLWLDTSNSLEKVLSVTGEQAFPCNHSLTYCYGLIMSLQKEWVLAAQSCPTLCNCMDCSSPGSSVHGILQARILGWVAITSSRVSSQARDQTQVSCIAGRYLTVWATGKPCKRYAEVLISVPLSVTLFGNNFADLIKLK